MIGEADVVAYHSARHGRSIARTIAEPYLRPGQIEEHLVYPVTTETTDHPGGYAGAMEDFYAEAADRIAAHLDAGRNVALLAEGDPLFYSSYMHMHTRLTSSVRRRHRAGRDVGERGIGGDRDAAGPGRRGADDPAGHAAPRRAAPQARRYRRRGDHEAGPIVSRCARGAFGCRTAGRGVLRGAGQHARSSGCCPPPTSTTRRCRTSRWRWCPAWQAGRTFPESLRSGEPPARTRSAASRWSGSAPATSTG